MCSYRGSCEQGDGTARSSCLQGLRYSPSPLLSAPLWSLLGGGSVAELVIEWLNTSLSEGCNTN